MIASGSAAVAKKGVTGIMSVFAAIGITSESIPLFLAVIIGLFGGTAAAWARERQNSRDLPKHWLAMQIAAYAMIFLIVIAINEYPGLSVRWSAALAALLSFASREGLTALHKRTVKEISERDISGKK